MTDDYEAVCKRCGRCCIVHNKAGRYWYETTKYCEHLKFIDGKATCMVYADRLKTPTDNNHHCVTADYAISIGLQPATCEYVKKWERETGRKYRWRVLKHEPKH